MLVILGAGFDDEKSLLMSQMSLEKRFGQSAVFVASTLMENGGVPQSATPETLLKEAIHVISCGYEDKTEWGTEVLFFSPLCLMFYYPTKFSVYFRWRNYYAYQFFFSKVMLFVMFYVRPNKKPSSLAIALHSYKFLVLQIGWIYGSVTEDILTGFKMHARGWRSIYCMPKRPAFKGSAPINLSDRLNQVLRWALGSVEILFSRHCPIWYGYGGRLKWLERFAYVNTTIYPITAIPLLLYCTLPAVCLLTNKFIIPQVCLLFLRDVYNLTSYSLVPLQIRHYF